MRKYVTHLAMRLANHQGLTKLLRSSDKEKILNAEKQICSMYRETKITTTAGFTYSYAALAKTENNERWKSVDILKSRAKNQKQNKAPILKDFFTHRKSLSKFKAE